MTRRMRWVLPALCSVLFSLRMHAQHPDSLPTLSPRPSALSGVSSPVLSLNGIWLFRSDSTAITAEAGIEQSDGWSPISVPAEWVMQAYTVKPGTFATYRRTFEVPADWAGKRIKLRFDGVHSLCYVRINGSRVGEHEGGFTVFEFDVTKQTRPGINELLVAVKSESVADTLASASQYAAHQLGGITRKVTLFAVPEVHVASLAANTVFDQQFQNGSLLLDVAVANESDRSAGSARLTLTLTDPAGEKTGVAPAAVTFGVVPAGESRSRSVSVRVPDAAKWDPEHPRLYTLTATLQEKDRTTEVLTQRIGFRQVGLRGNRVFVNGHPIKMHGVNRHEVHPTLGRSLTPELWRRDAELFREANVNYIRTSHYPPAEEFLDACDELGIFVECEAALCWVQHGANEKWKDWDYRDKKFLPYLLRANLENVAANRHHPSIIIWSLANESYWSPSFARVLEAVRRADPSRLTSFHDQCWGQYNNGGSKAQVAVFHYPDEKSPERCNQESRPVLFGEYTHVECYNRSETVTDPGIRDNWGGPFERMYNLVYRNEGCLGGAIWAGIDEIFTLPDGRICGYGPWGIIDGWRRPKPEYWHVKKSYSPVRVVARQAPHIFPNGAIHVPLENRYDFTDLSELDISWKIGDEEGNASAKGRPHEHGMLIIRPMHQPVPGEHLQLTFRDARGFVCETEELFIISRPMAPASAGDIVPAVTLDSTQVRYIVKGKGFACEVDRLTGRIVQAEVDGRPSLAGGPDLMILPLQSGECLPNYRADFPPLNNSCTGWRQKSIRAVRVEDGAARIISEGAYTEAEGSSTLTIRGDAEIHVDYSFRLLRDVDPRQWGMVLYAPPDLDSLCWERIGQWNTYPHDHIGRRSGSAVAHPSPGGAASFARVRLGHWSEDANELGTNDFRSTKSMVIAASLLSADGSGILLTNGGPQAVRAFVDNQRIGLLLAGFNTGGADPFFAPHYSAERKPLKKGDTIAGKFSVRLIHK